MKVFSVVLAAAKVLEASRNANMVFQAKCSMSLSALGPPILRESVKLTHKIFMKGAWIEVKFNKDY